MHTRIYMRQRLQSISEYRMTIHARLRVGEGTTLERAFISVHGLMHPLWLSKCFEVITKGKVWGDCGGDKEGVGDGGKEGCNNAIKKVAMKAAVKAAEGSPNISSENNSKMTSWLPISLA